MAFTHWRWTQVAGEAVGYILILRSHGHGCGRLPEAVAGRGRDGRPFEVGFLRAL